MPQYQSLVTLSGQAKVAAAIGGGPAVNISHLAVGDGNGNPVTALETATGLTNEVWRGAVLSVSRDPAHPTQVIVAAEIPVGAGPFVIREMGLIASDGTLFAIQNTPEIEKTTAAQGATQAVTVHFRIVVATSANITITVDANSLVSVAGLHRAPFIAIDAFTNAVPGAPATGALVVVGSAPTGAFAGLSNRFAQWTGTLWVNAVAHLGTVVHCIADGKYYRRTADGWVEFLATFADPGLITLALLDRMPVYPEIDTATNTLAITAAGGQIVIDANQQWRHRGHRVINTSDVLAAARTFATAASKKYHLRGTVAAGVNTYSLFDVTALSEADAEFDTTFDMMLIALVVTNGANVATVTPLVNRNELRATVAAALVNEANAGANEYAGSFLATLNWARRPRPHSFAPLRRVWDQGGTTPDRDFAIWPSSASTPWGAAASAYGLSLTRYGVTARINDDHMGVEPSIWQFSGAA
jgi:hypothetical protein